jgi:hypothetical protein
VPHELARLHGMPTRVSSQPNDVDSVRSYIEKTVRA